MLATLPHSSITLQLVAALCAACVLDTFTSHSPPCAPDRLCRCLEVGCGSGYVICSVALALQQLYSSAPSPGGAPAAATAAGQRSKACASLQPWRFVATDINPAALAATTATLEAHGVRGGPSAGQACVVLLPMRM